MVAAAPPAATEAGSSEVEAEASTGHGIAGDAGGGSAHVEATGEVEREEREPSPELWLWSDDGRAAEEGSSRVLRADESGVVSVEYDSHSCHTCSLGVERWRCDDGRSSSSAPSALMPGYGWRSGDGCSATAIAPPRRPRRAARHSAASSASARMARAAAHQKDAPRGGAESWSATTTEVAASTAQ